MSYSTPVAHFFGWPAGSDDSGGKRGDVCVRAENSIILLKTVEGWALPYQPGELCSWIWDSALCFGVLQAEYEALLTVTVYSSWMWGWGQHCPRAEGHCFLPAVPLPPAVPRVRGGRRLRALPRGVQPAGIPLHGGRGLLGGGRDAVGAAPSPAAQPKEEPPPPLWSIQAT